MKDEKPGRGLFGGIQVRKRILRDTDRAQKAFGSGQGRRGKRLEPPPIELRLVVAPDVEMTLAGIGLRVVGLNRFPAVIGLRLLLGAAIVTGRGRIDRGAVSALPPNHADDQHGGEGRAEQRA